MATRSRKKPMTTPKRGVPFYLPLRTDCKNWVGRQVHELARIEMVGPASVEGFLDDDVRLITGDRGSGKSLSLLRKAARMLLDSDATYATLTPQNPFRNELAPGSVRLTKDRVEMMAGYPKWTAYWKLTLLAHFAVMALYKRNAVRAKSRAEALSREFRVPLAEAERAVKEYGWNPTPYRAADFYSQVLHEAVGQMESLSRSLNALIAAGASSSEAQSWCEPLTISLNESLRDKKLSIFADGIDEALGTPQGTAFFAWPSDAEKTEGSPPTSLSKMSDPVIELGVDEAEQPVFRATVHNAWLGVQVGYAIAAAEISTEFHGRLMAFGVVRPEAAAALAGDTAWTTRQKAEGVLYRTLKYDSEHLREILHLNIKWWLRQKSEGQRQKDSDRAADDRQRLFNLFRFYGVSHSTVPFRVEPLDEIILRHAFNAPRQIVGLLAKAVDGATASVHLDTDKAAEKVTQAINEEARIVYGDYVASVSPPWHGGLDLLVCKLRSNVITAGEMATFENENRAGSFFAALYSRGLAGIPEFNSNRQTYQQSFHKPNGEELQVPVDTPYVVLHPALAANIIQTLGPDDQRKFYSAEFVAGERLSCPAKLLPPRIALTFRAEEGWTLKLFNSDGTIVVPELCLLSDVPMTILSCIVAAMKTNGSTTIKKDALPKQMATLRELSAGPSTIHRVDAEEWLKNYLISEKTNSNELKSINKVLDSALLAVHHSADAGTFSLCTKKTTDETYHTWVPMSIGAVSLRLHLPRRAYGLDSELLTRSPGEPHPVPPPIPESLQ